MPKQRKKAGRSSISRKQQIQQLLDNPPSHETIRSEVQLAVDDGNIQAIRELTAGDQAKLLEIIDQVSACRHDPPLRGRLSPSVTSTLIPLNLKNHEQAAPTVLVRDTKFVTALGNISSDLLLVPSSTGALRGLQKRGGIAIASGGTTDIWRGSWNNQQVALKAFRVYRVQDLREAKRILWKLVPIWKRLVHENVLSFHGVDMSIFQLALVYDWGYNGNIIQYLESHPGGSRSSLVSIHPNLVYSVSSDQFLKLLQVTKGLQYLHSLDIIHGNLKGVSEPAPPQVRLELTDSIQANVLISKSGKAQICDYGLSPIISNPIFTIARISGVPGSFRWLAPEIIDPPNNKPRTASKPADIFAFAMLAMEVFTGEVPFGNMTNMSVVLHIVTGKRPARPQDAGQFGLTTEMWKFIEKCWSANPNKRPTTYEVVTKWEGIINWYVLSCSDAHKPTYCVQRQPAFWVESFRTSVPVYGTL